MKKLHILGICGTFMGSLAVLAKQAGFAVSGSDSGVYPPMSTQLENQGIVCKQGYEPAHLNGADYIVIGNALSRGNPAVEHILNARLPYCSGPQWLAEHVLKDRWVLAVAGTHGKTTTASMLAWILDYAGLNPGFLIGGVPKNFDCSARLGESPYFVVEADEYDTAFFDKRSKFLHYLSKTVILNNLEYDHADIFPDLAAIQRQFHHLVRTIPANGLIIQAATDKNLEAVIEQGCWTPQTRFGQDGDWTAKFLNANHQHYEVYYQGKLQAEVNGQVHGLYNQHNALAAIAAADHVGVKPSLACEALNQFSGVKRRMELRGVVNEIRVYDDFAHHPTAIKASLGALRQTIGAQRLIAVLEPRSNTMKMGIHRHSLAASLSAADKVFIYQDPAQDWQFEPGDLSDVQLAESVDNLLSSLKQQLQKGDHVLIMSNGGFANLHQRLLDLLNG